MTDLELYLDQDAKYFYVKESRTKSLKGLLLKVNGGRAVICEPAPLWEIGNQAFYILCLDN